MREILEVGGTSPPPIHTVPASVSAVVLFINIRGIVIIASRI